MLIKPSSKSSFRNPLEKLKRFPSKIVLGQIQATSFMETVGDMQSSSLLNRCLIWNLLDVLRGCK